MLQKVNFQMKFLLYQEVSAFGLPQRDAYHLKSWEKRAMCTKVSYNATFDRRRIFLNDISQKNVKKKVSLTFGDSSKDLSSGCTKRLIWVLRCPLDCLKKQLRAFQGYTRSWMGGPAKVYFGCRTTFLQLSLPCAIISYDSHHLNNCLKGVSTNAPQPLLSAFVTLGLRQKPLSRNICEKLSRKQGLLGRFCCRIRCALHNTQLSTFGNLVLWDRVW